MMYDINQVRHVHLEISSRCNAACPLCPRNFYGYPYNDGYLEHDMTLSEAQQIFSKEFLGQIKEIYVNGNFGDAVMNPHTVSILSYFKQTNPDLSITISTNAGARDREFWQALARLGTIVHFCIDGLEDTHSLYRQNTLYSTVIRNAQIFISAGGHAVWKMIEFDHNQHQWDQARALASTMGFQEFRLVNHGRDQAPVYNTQGQLTHVIGRPKTTDFKVLFDSRKTDEVLLEDIVPGREPKPIGCQVQKNKSVYISSTGDVYPCCFLGFNPRQYGHGNYHQAANAQVSPLIKNNNALENSMESCISWFSAVENSWSIPTFEAGRLVICNDVCGQSQ
jgi:MoaA/NifB/PqqE/SkfB family radical SAM enzyme